MKALYHWAGKSVHKPYATLIFTCLVFIEAFFFMPSSTLLTIFGLERRRDVFWFAFLATMASVVGAMAAYGFGYLLWDSVGKYVVGALMSPASFEKMVSYYTHYQVAAVLITTFLPLPYKVVTLTAGFCHIAFVPFVLCCAASRALRFSLLAVAIWYWGERIQQILDRYFYSLVMLGIAILIISGLLIK